MPAQHATSVALHGEVRVAVVPGIDSSYPSGRKAGGRKQWFWRSLVARKITLFLPGNNPKLSDR